MSDGTCEIFNTLFTFFVAYEYKNLDKNLTTTKLLLIILKIVLRFPNKISANCEINVA